MIVTVSMSSHGNRISTTHRAIKSILSGTVKPFKMILWLNSEDFRNVPDSLIQLKKDGLEIFPTIRDWGPHQKYYPYVQILLNHSMPLVTADDDVIYPENWLEGLINSSRKSLNDFICYRARRIILNKKGLSPYLSWPLCNNSTSSFLNFSTGVSGQLIPVPLLNALYKTEKEFLTRCPKNDDIWLHVSAIRQGIKIRQVESKARIWKTLEGTQKDALAVYNTSHGGNDLQIRATYTNNDVELLKSFIEN